MTTPKYTQPKLSNLSPEMLVHAEKYRNEILGRAASNGIEAYAPVGSRRVLLVIMPVEQLAAILEVLKGSEKL